MHSSWKQERLSLFKAAKKQEEKIKDADCLDCVAEALATLLFLLKLAKKNEKMKKEKGKATIGLLIWKRDLLSFWGAAFTQKGGWGIQEKAPIGFLSCRDVAQTFEKEGAETLSFFLSLSLSVRC